MTIKRTKTGHTAARAKRQRPVAAKVARTRSSDAGHVTSKPMLIGYGGLATPEPLNVRLGIASGLVVVGDLIGAGAAQERGVVGETPNLAARLQALAPPGTLA